MARNRILFVLTAIAVSLLVLGTVLISQPPYPCIYGSIWKGHGEHDGDMYVHWAGAGAGQSGWVLATWVPKSSTWYYCTPQLAPETYAVWAEYEDELEICQTPEEEVEVMGDPVPHDITVESGDCEDKP